MRVLQEQFKLEQYDTIIWTGGIVDLHKKRIEKIQGEISSFRMVDASKEDCTSWILYDWKSSI